MFGTIFKEQKDLKEGLNVIFDKDVKDFSRGGNFEY